MLIELTKQGIGGSMATAPWLVDSSQIVGIAEPLSEGDLDTGGCFVDVAGGNKYLVADSFAEVREKWETALRRDCDCPTFPAASDSGGKHAEPSEAPAS